MVDDNTARLRAAIGRAQADDALIGMAYEGLALVDAAELDALRAVAKAARDAIPLDKNERIKFGRVVVLTEKLKALDRAREGGGG